LHQPQTWARAGSARGGAHGGISARHRPCRADECACLGRLAGRRTLRRGPSSRVQLHAAATRSALASKSQRTPARWHRGAECHDKSQCQPNLVLCQVSGRMHLRPNAMTSVRPNAMPSVRPYACAYLVRNRTKLWAKSMQPRSCMLLCTQDEAGFSNPASSL
jgi:hypothetical protein